MRIDIRNRKRARTDQGWTLIELLVVISIIMILASMALVEYRNSVTAAKEATLRSQLFIMRDAIDQYYADKAKYPESLQSLVSESYLRALPRDPFTTSTDTWQTTPAEPDGSNVTASAGIFDVKSGYEGTAIDGSRIADWFSYAMTMLKTPTERREAGFAMVALLVGMAVAAVWMTAALPAWRQQVMRQKEEDLIFRGEQYTRAIVLFQQRNRGANPPSIDVLVSGHYLRKKWKDPITNDDFFLLGNGISQPGVVQQSGSSQQPGRAGQPGAPGQQAQQGQQPGITGVRSKSTATSIKIYQQQQQHSMWPFDANLMALKMVRQQQQAGGGQPGRQGQGGDRGGPGRAGQPGRGGQQVGPGGGPVRGGGDRPGGGGPGGPPPPGRGAGS